MLFVAVEGYPTLHLRIAASNRRYRLFIVALKPITYLRAVIDVTDTIVALATPPGVGAIGVIRLSGKDAISICDRVFRGKDLSKQDTHTLHFGTIREDDQILDEVLVSIFIAPNSYTGENIIEVSTHGSSYIQQRIIQLFIRGGARSATQGEFTKRAFMNGKLDLSQAEAVADLIASESEAAQQIAMKQMRGGFSNEIAQLRQKLVDFASLIELELDFSEEDVEFADRSQLEKLISKVISVTGALVESFKMGNVIKNGVPVTIAGRPNVGKSTLLNTLLKEERAIVSDIAGTTRDTIEEQLNIDGTIFRFVDTAGLRETADTIEAMGVQKSMEKIQSSAIIMYLFDANLESLSDLQSAKNMIISNDTRRDTLILWVGNKSDLVPNLEAKKAELSDLGQMVFISAKHQNNIEDLKASLLAAVSLEKANPDQTIITNSRHYSALFKANTALIQVSEGLGNQISGDLLAMDIRQALHYLGEITGEITTDDLLGNIFSKFCIGK